MTEPIIAPTECEFVSSIEAQAKKAREQAAIDWSGPHALAYAHCSLLMRRIVHDHISSGACPVCSDSEDRRRAAAASIAGLVGDLPYHRASLGVTQ